MTTTPRNTPVSINEFPWSDPSRGQRLPVDGRRVPEDGALRRPLIGARSPSCQWGREQPPGLERVPTPAPARRVAHAPMSGPECSRVLAVMRAECTRVVTCERAADPSRNAPYFLFHHYVRQNIGHHITRIELCSASSRLSLRSTLRATALTAPPRSSRSHLCDGRRSSSSFLR
jgi:hypothetical protein